MPLENIIEHTADISLVEWQTEPVVMMNDDITFIFTIQKDGLAYPLDNVTKATLACTRRDGKTILTSGTPNVEAGTVTFDIGRKETAVDGRTQMVIQLYDDLQNRVSTIRGTMYVQLDPTGETYAPLTEELTLIEEVLYDAPPIIEAAQTATLGAIQAKDDADVAVQIIEGKQAEVDLFLIDSDAAFTQSQSGRANAFVDEQGVRSDVFNQSQFDREQTYDSFEALKEDEFQTFKTAKNNEVQTVIGEADTKIAEVQQVALANKIIPLPTVATIALRNSTYPNPQHGSVVIVSQGVNPLDAETYRFVSGTGWVLIDRYSASTITNITASLADMASKTELNALGQLKLEDTFVTLTELETAHPTGAEGLFLVTVDGFTYRWNGSSWVQAAQFQSTGIADESVTLDSIFNASLLTGYAESTESSSLPSSVNDAIAVELSEKGDVFVTNGNMIDLFGLTDGTYTQNGITIVVSGNQFAVSGTAAANTTFQITEGSKFVPSTTSLNKPLDNLPQMSAFSWSLYDRVNNGTGFNILIRSTVSGNYQTVNTGDTNPFDNMTDTTQVGQLYMFIQSGFVVDATFKLMFSPALRLVANEKSPSSQKLANVKNTRLLANGYVLSNKAGNVKPLVNINDLVTPPETVDNGVYVESHTDHFLFYIKGTKMDSNKWLRYRFEYWNGIGINNGQGWVLGVVDAVEKVGNSWNVIYPVVKAGEWEMALRLDGRPDFIGCKQHGSEINFYEKFYIDGTQWTPNESSFWCKEIKVIEKSTMYDPTDEVTVVGTHRKAYSINHERIQILQKIKWDSALTMGNNDVYIAMLPIIRGNDATTAFQITSKAYNDDTYEEIDVSSASHSARTAKHEPDKWTLYSNVTGISASIESISDNKLVGANSFVQNSASYNKVYFNACSPAYITSVGEVWENEITYHLNINV